MINHVSSPPPHSVGYEKVEILSPQRRGDLMGGDEKVRVTRAPLKVSLSVSKKQAFLQRRVTAQRGHSASYFYFLYLCEVHFSLVLTKIKHAHQKLNRKSQNKSSLIIKKIQHTSQQHYIVSTADTEESTMPNLGFTVDC